VSERVHDTIRRLLDAGAEVFSAQGYHSASVDDIVQEAGLGRGTFYKYFNDKLDLLTMLAEECVERLQALAVSFAEIRPSRQQSGVALRAWLDEFLLFHRQYTGVFRSWQDRGPNDTGVQDMGQQSADTVLSSLDQVLESVERAYCFSVPAGSLVMLALLEHLPDQVVTAAHDLPDDMLAELLATLIERGLFNRPMGMRLAALA
jgi:AcrR family transcriptional regulator